MTQLDLGGLAGQRGRRPKGEDGKIYFCLMCGEKLSKIAIVRQNVLCRCCLDKLSERFEYNLPADRPIYPTVEQAYAHLFLAIRNRAKLDHKLGEWETYWLEETDLLAQMRDVLETMRSDHTLHQSRNLVVHGRKALA